MCTHSISKNAVEFKKLSTINKVPAQTVKHSAHNHSANYYPNHEEQILKDIPLSVLDKFQSIAKYHEMALPALKDPLIIKQSIGQSRQARYHHILNEKLDYQQSADSHSKKVQGNAIKTLNSRNQVEPSSNDIKDSRSRVNRSMVVNYTSGELSSLRKQMRTGSRFGSRRNSRRNCYSISGVRYQSSVENPNILERLNLMARSEATEYIPNAKVSESSAKSKVGKKCFTFGNPLNICLPKESKSRIFCNKNHSKDTLKRATLTGLSKLETSAIEKISSPLTSKVPEKSHQEVDLKKPVYSSSKSVLIKRYRISQNALVQYNRDTLESLLKYGKSQKVFNTNDDDRDITISSVASSISEGYL